MGIFIFNGNRIKRFPGGSQYDGEKLPGDLTSWNVLTTDPNYIIESTYGSLQKRSMTLYHTHPLCTAAVDKQTMYAVGPGLVFRSQPDSSTIGKTKSWAKDWGKEFQKIVHYYFQEFGFYEKQSVLFRSALAGGDSWLSFDRDEKGNLNDLVEFGGDHIDWEKNGDNYTLGIRHDKLLRRLGVMTVEGDDINFRNSNGDQLIIQLVFKKLCRQLRGYPLLYTIINLAKQDDRHIDATVKRAVMEAIIMASAKGEGVNWGKKFDNLDDVAQENKRGGAFTRVLARFGSKEVPSGTVINIGKDDEWNFHDIKTPSNTFGDFKTWILNYIAAGTETPPEIILGKYDSSYSARQGAFNDFEKSFMNKRKITERICLYPVIREIAKDAIMQGLIEAPGFFGGHPIIQRAYLQGMVLGPVPGAINPLQEVNAHIKAVDAGFELRSDIAALYGNEWDNFIEEWGQEQDDYFSKSPEKRAEIMQQEEENQDQTNNQNVGGGNASSQTE